MNDAIVFNTPQILSAIFSFFAILSAVAVISVKNPVSSAFSLILVLVNVAAIFAIQEAHFIAAVQLLVYAGAIMVLFVFVIMLLNIEKVELDYPKNKKTFFISGILGLVIFALLSAAFIKGGTATNRSQFSSDAIANSGGNLRVIAEVMFSDYVLPFEIIAILLLMAVVGAIVLAKRKVE